MLSPIPPGGATCERFLWSLFSSASLPSGCRCRPWLRPSDPPNAWGQHRADVNALLQGGEPVEIDGDMVNNWGHDILPAVKALGAELGFMNWGKTVGALKIFYSE